MHSLLAELGLGDPAPGVICGDLEGGSGAIQESFSPIDGASLGRVRTGSDQDYEEVARRTSAAFRKWRMVPAPARGEIVRQIGEELRRHKKTLGRLITLQTGKVLTEGEGEVQEAIDIADFATGLSRQLHGLSMHSERARHRMYEQWHPLGVVGIITAFNFPCAVWAWNSMIAAVCGDTMIWKPSEKTPIVSIAVQKIVTAVLRRHGHGEVMALCIGSVEAVGSRMLEDRRLPLISATGSCAMGRTVGERVARRLGRTLLELGGNNAIVVLDDADLKLATTAITFGAVGTAGQRCTSTRRVLMEKGIAGDLTLRLKKAYASVRIGDPLDPGTLMGPLIDAQAVEQFARAIERIREQGGEILHGGRVLKLAELQKGCFVEPTLVRSPADLPMMQHETFAPILYLVEIDSLEEAIRLQNEVPQGLSSAIFTRGFHESERFLSHEGSDCGIANVNIGTSGAEIGGAFGGEKDTGGGRESGSDAWKAYMRRQTCTLNYSAELPLAQGVQFDLPV